ncbi:thermonuclease family protein [Pelagibacterium xiamenense]|uniref:thermonuclease family protein n=1 Tax=Pelagibacterium xiamenense TaxID=2901140 RepID=UPI001E457037|nr:thermonuclease family protein [Pelagibacterium xiamenense]MCD7060562.1 thermonuclease family protein [Pelagibacterium xiamenense]
MGKIVPFGRAGVRRQRRAQLPLFEMLLAFAAVAALGYFAIERGYVEVPSLSVPVVQIPADTIVAQRFSLCSSGAATCVTDGDTIKINGVRIRIADIDTPEVFSYQCAEELALGQRATRRMLELVNAGGFEMTMWDHRDEDVYGRKLRVLTRDGQSLGMILVAEGLARPWGGARRSWCG